MTFWYSKVACHDYSESILSNSLLIPGSSVFKTLLYRVITIALAGSSVFVLKFLKMVLLLSWMTWWRNLGSGKDRAKPQPCITCTTLVQKTLPSQLFEYMHITQLLFFSILQKDFAKMKHHWNYRIDPCGNHRINTSWQDTSKKAHSRSGILSWSITM